MRKITGFFVLLVIISVVIGISAVMAQTSSPSPTPTPSISPTPTPTPLPQPLMGTYWFQNGQYPTTAYAGTSDTYIYKTSPTLNYGTSAIVSAGGPAGSERHGLLKFDISPAPSTCKVTSVKVSLNVTDGSIIGYYVYAINKNWSESSANWNQYSTGNLWQTAGANGSGDVGGVVLAVIPGTTGFKTTAFNAAGISYIQKLVSKTVINNGFVIKYDATSDTLGFSSKNSSVASQRPKLEIVCAPVLYMLGDPNLDGKINIADIVAIAQSQPQLRPTPKVGNLALIPQNCPAAADFDKNGKVNINDAIALISFLFGSSEAPNPVQPLTTQVTSPLGCVKYP